MKKVKKFLLLLFVAFACGIYSSYAQVYIHARPPRPPHVRIEAPGPRHVWIDEDWEPRGGVYVDIGGHWVEPPRPGVVWVPGHWRNTRHGWYWIPGHWR